jgi:hypothetical protein
MRGPQNATDRGFPAPRDSATVTWQLSYDTACGSHPVGRVDVLRGAPDFKLGTLKLSFPVKQ